MHILGMHDAHGDGRGGITCGPTTEKDGDLKICSPVGQIDHKNVKNMDKLLSN